MYSSVASTLSFTYMVIHQSVLIHYILYYNRYSVCTVNINIRAKEVVAEEVKTSCFTYPFSQGC